MRGLELGDGDLVVFAGVVSEGRLVEPGELVVERAAEPRAQHPGTGIELFVERQMGALGLRLERDGEVAPRSATRGLDPRFVDVEVVGVEHDLVDRFDHFHRDALLAGERCRIEVGLDRELVARRHDCSRQTVPILFGHGCVRYWP